MLDPSSKVATYRPTTDANLTRHHQLALGVRRSDQLCRGQQHLMRLHCDLQFAARHTRRLRRIRCQNLLAQDPSTGIDTTSHLYQRIHKVLAGHRLKLDPEKLSAMAIASSSPFSMRRGSTISASIRERAAWPSIQNRPSGPKSFEPRRNGPMWSSWATGRRTLGGWGSIWPRCKATTRR